MEKQHTCANEHEQVMEMLRFIFETYKGGSALGSRSGVSRLLNDCARAKGIDPAGKSKADLYLELAHVAHPDALRVIHDRVETAWRLAGGERHQAQRVNRLKQVYYNAGDTLNAALCNKDPRYSSSHTYYQVTTDDERKTIEEVIIAACEELDIEHEEMSYERAYVEVVKRLGGTHR